MGLQPLHQSPIRDICGQSRDALDWGVGGPWQQGLCGEVWKRAWRLSCPTCFFFGSSSVHSWVTWKSCQSFRIVCFLRDLWRAMEAICFRDFFWASWYSSYTCGTDPHEDEYPRFRQFWVRKLLQRSPLWQTVSAHATSIEICVLGNAAV